ncbi:beta-glucoside-specific PTS transporter subunit IIABC [Enterococcus sp. LJL90]
MSEKVRDYNKLAKDILTIVGAENVSSVSRCATRLRLVLKESSSEMKEQLSELTGVITAVESGGQMQIVIGTHVGEVYDAFVGLGNMESLSSDDDAPKSSILNRLIATMSAVFAPFIYVLAAAGILQGILILVTLAFPEFAATGTYQVFSFISWAPFTFLPIFIAITASRHFKSNMYIAIACCAALVSPTWAEMAGSISAGEVITFFNIPLSETVYTSSVLPPLLLVWLLSYLEHFIEKRIPNVVRSLFVPLICLVIMVPLTILIIGPVSAGAATAIANGYNFLAETVPAVAAAIIGGVWSVFVIFGVHWGVTPMVLANFDMYGRDSFQAFQTIAVIAQVGAALAVFLKSRNKEMKGVSLSAFITGIFGITEPAIYGVTLRLKRPFIYGCISGAIGAIVASFFNPYYYAYAGLPGPLTVVNGINADNPSSFIGILIGAAIALIGPVVLVQLFGSGESLADDQELNQELADSEHLIAVDGLKTPVLAPLAGEVLPLGAVPDPVFSSGAMGSGVAIEPSDNQVYAPFSGKVTVVFDSKHAVGLTSNDGVELLIHVGLDTVNLKGEGFEYFVKQDQEIQAGDLLLSFDSEVIKAAGYPTTTIVVIPNSAELDDVLVTEKASVAANEPILEFN